MPSRRSAIAAVLLVTTLGARAAEDPPAPLPVPLVEQVRSELVLIEVYARDLKGHLVTDLRADELTLRIVDLQKPQAVRR
jgi:hypothetical protein